MTSVPMPDIDANDVRHLTAVLEPPAEWGVGDDVPATTFEGVEPDDRVTVAGYGVFWVTHVPVRSHQVLRRLECRWVR